MSPRSTLFDFLLLVINSLEHRGDYRYAEEVGELLCLVTGNTEESKVVLGRLYSIQQKHRTAMQLLDGLESVEAQYYCAKAKLQFEPHSVVNLLSESIDKIPDSFNVKLLLPISPKEIGVTCDESNTENKTLHGNETFEDLMLTLVFSCPADTVNATQLVNKCYAQFKNWSLEKQAIYENGVVGVKRSRLDLSQMIDAESDIEMPDTVSAFFCAHSVFIQCQNYGKYYTGINHAIPSLSCLKSTVASFWCELGEYSQVRKYAITAYTQACTIFEDIILNQPFYLNNMEFYIFALWNLNNQRQLSALRKSWARDVVSQGLAAMCHVCVLSKQEQYDLCILEIQKCRDLKLHVADATDFIYVYELINRDELAHAQSVANRITSSTWRSKADMAIGIAQYRSTEYVKALSALRGCLDQRSEDPMLHAYIGSAQMKLGRLTEALKSSDCALAYGSNLKAQFLRASILAEMGSSDAAISEFINLKNAAPDEPAVYLGLAKLYMKQSNHNEALRCLTFAHDRDPGNVDVLNLLERYKVR